MLIEKPGPSCSVQLRSFQLTTTYLPSMWTVHPASALREQQHSTDFYKEILKNKIYLRSILVTKKIRGHPNAVQPCLVHPLLKSGAASPSWNSCTVSAVSATCSQAAWLTEEPRPGQIAVFLRCLLLTNNRCCCAEGTHLMWRTRDF